MGPHVRRAPSLTEELGMRTFIEYLIGGRRPSRRNLQKAGFHRLTRLADPCEGRPSFDPRRIATTGQKVNQVLRLRLTDDPGWHATIDGHSVSLEPFGGVMMQLRIPPGHHVIEVSYWPTLFTVGLILSGSCAIVLLVALVMARSRRHNPTLER